MIRPGVSTAELDLAAERFIRSQGATPTFKGYRGFPGSICASPNAMIVHGIPGSYTLKRGDIISIDVGVTLDGWVADAARTFPVEEIERARAEPARAPPSARCTPASSSAGWATAWATSRAPSSEWPRVPASRSCARSSATASGRSMHEDPQVPNYGRPGKGPLLEEGMVLAIEPMTTAGRPAVRVAGDGWAIYSQDGSPAAHFEFTVAITAEGPRVLTPWHLHADDRLGRSRCSSEVAPPAEPSR